MRKCHYVNARMMVQFEVSMRYGTVTSQICQICQISWIDYKKLNHDNKTIFFTIYETFLVYSHLFSFCVLILRFTNLFEYHSSMLIFPSFS